MSRTEQYERYEGGSAEADRLVFESLAEELMRVQAEIRKSSGAAALVRNFHAKPVLGVENARLRIHDQVPPELQTGYVRPGAEYPVTVRLSNASGTPQADSLPDMRGAALRVEASDGTNDLLMTNFPVSHARNAREFVAFARTMAGARSRLQTAFALFVKLPFAVGRSAAARMRRNVRAGAGGGVRSLALETYWSRGAVLWGEAGPVRYQLRPVPGAPDAPVPPRADPDHLSRELGQRLARGDVAFELLVQRPLPFPDGAFDDAIACLVLHYLEDWTAPLAELRRVLARGGRLIVAVNHPFVYRLQHPRADYFATSKWSEEYTFSGQSATLTYWHRPLHAMTSAFTAAGFRIAVISELPPAPGARERFPGVFEEVFGNLPSATAFLCFLFVVLEAA
ncbi:methyltransferase domain-containing protein [Streptomyces sp. NPDC054783]